MTDDEQNFIRLAKLVRHSHAAETGAGHNNVVNTLDGLFAIIDRQAADLDTFGKDTEATENRIIDAEFAATELRGKLEQIACVCRDNAAPTCNKGMALDFVRQVAEDRRI